MKKEEMIAKITANTDEVIGLDDLANLIDTNTPLSHYIGFEISGLVHLGTGLSSMLKIKELQEAGVSCCVLLADWHTWINDKLNGDRAFIQKVAKEYFQPAMEISARIVGADPSQIRFVHGSDLYHNNDAYWQSVVEISKNLTLSRVVKSTTIMGRNESEKMVFAFLIYPPMQVADIMHLQANIAHAGMDQRKIHVIAREVAPHLTIKNLKDSNGKIVKPVSIHHHLLLGLQKPQTWPIPEGVEKDVIRTEMKMSKSKPGSAIFIHDSEDEIRSKIQKAFCPEKITDLNPIMDWVEHLLFPIDKVFHVNRDERFGGSFTTSSYEELKERYEKGDLHPVDLKNAVSERLIPLLAPARTAFAQSDKQQMIQDIWNIKNKVA